jgi:predicted DNA-binding protein
MPSSVNRHRVEIPAELYQRVKERADRTGTTVAAELVGLVEDGITMQEEYGRLSAELHEIRRVLTAR